LLHTEPATVGSQTVHPTAESARAITIERKTSFRIKGLQ
jgi:hypothetical protein